ncbi:MAG: hypothetical protein AAGC57_06130 [Pseudomonadota bacterium]
MIAAPPQLDDLDAPRPPFAGDIPSPLERQAGCVFHAPCPSLLADRCHSAVPECVEVDAAHRAACHLRSQEAAE